MLKAPAWPAFLMDMEPPQRNLTLALGVSLFLHVILLSIHFKLPDALNKATEQALDVILVNNRSASKPVKTQAKAQANLDGGGNTVDPRRAKTPLPPSRQTREGDSLVEAQRRVDELEAQQRQMMTQLRSQRAVAADPGRSEAAPPAPAQVSGLDLASSALAVARLEGQIARNLEEYNQRPRRKFIGARVEEYRFAQYVEDWRQKIERIGNLNYPESAKGRLYGSLVLTVVIKSDGSLDRVEVNRPSGHKVLDDSARRIVQMASPYAPFPEAIRRDTDIIEITRTWTFTSADRLSSN
ncbi:MAG: TonB family protein [Candidatus Nitricoxidivorans perseverans]|uniref:TonB family protein n=1 Tax=Candidatus Nitricoxidivorans perseverans TaxID=2975601 RepID=A0AA49IXF3_9PROT|nr:MAG: TonB family protein [Candidatus Nitricoxidivorans perseverans]